MKTLLYIALLGCHGSKLHKLQIVSGQFDAATTYYTMTQYRNTYEMNPLYRPFAGNKTAFPAMLVADYLTVRLENHIKPNHPKIAKAIAIMDITSHVVCGIHNIELDRSLPGWTRK